MRKRGTKENFSKSIAWDVHHLKNLPIPSTWTRSFLRCFRSQSLLNAAKVKALVPAKSHNPLLWRTLFPPVWRVQSELFSLKLYFLQQSSKWPLKETGGRRILHHGANTVMLYFTSTFHLSYLTLMKFPLTLTCSQAHPAHFITWRSMILMIELAEQSGKYLTGPQVTQVFL